jgi:hypothetical protein
MPEDLDSRYRLVLAKQLTLNEQTWNTLQRRGVTGAMLLRLDFMYIAADQASAQALKSVLSDETDYEVAVESAGSFLRKHWTVTGSTQPTNVSKEILDQWVDWMVTAGLHQNCEFDGWGTQL